MSYQSFRPRIQDPDAKHDAKVDAKPSRTAGACVCTRCGGTKRECRGCGEGREYCRCRAFAAKTCGMCGGTGEVVDA